MQVSRLGKRLPPPVRRVVRREVVRYRSRGLRPSDVLLVSYPKSGSTWLRFLLAQALTEREPDFDSIRDTVPPVGRHRHAPSVLAGGGRLVRSHEPLPPVRHAPGRRTVYLVRDGRDVALSYFAHEQRYGRFHGDLEQFLDRFTRGLVDSYGAWHDHVLGALAHERHGSAPVLRVRYEDLRADTVGELERVLSFLGAEVDAQALPALVAANSKERMREKESTSAFLASMTTNGTPFVRPDGDRGWTDRVPVAARAGFEAVCARALVAAGYRLSDG
jgi:hypothetical protein